MAGQPYGLGERGRRDDEPDRRHRHEQRAVAATRLVALGRFAGRRVLVVVSGGNVDDAVYDAIVGNA